MQLQLGHHGSLKALVQQSDPHAQLTAGTNECVDLTTDVFTCVSACNHRLTNKNKYKPFFHSVTSEKGLEQNLKHEHHKDTLKKRNH